MVHVGLTADSVADLVGHVSDLVHGIRQEAVRFHEVEGAESEQLERDAHVAVVVKPVQHLHTVTGETRSTEMRCIRQTCIRRVTSSQSTHCLLAGSPSLIFSSTLISSLAASLYFSKFLMIFRATRLPPLRVKTLGLKYAYNMFHIGPTFIITRSKITCYGPNIVPPSQMFPHLKC